MNYTREQALQRIRQFLVANTRDDKTTCQAAARLGIFCRGYLKLVVAWDNARALVHLAPTTCDAKMLDHEGCLGFDRFSDMELKEKFPQLFGDDDEIST